MLLTMIEKQFLIINLLCVITITISAKSLGYVKEYNIGNAEGTENSNDRPTSTNDTEATMKYIKKIGTTKTKEIIANNNEPDSMYTESDLEEAVSRELDGPETKDQEQEKDLNENTELNDQLLNVYTESDLEETVSQDNEKHEVDKRSANSYLYEPPNREEGGFDGSGEGSGDSPAVK